MWLTFVAIATMVLGAALVVALTYGSHRWKAGTRELRSRLETTRIRTQAHSRVNFREIEDLPLPVRRYLRAALQDGQPTVAAVYVEHAGMFNIGETTDRWKPFRSTQRVITHPPGFDWDARISMLPGLPVHVHDAYVAGEGLLYVACFGLVPLVNIRDSVDVAQGQLIRFFAEATWYPTVLLPNRGVRWKAVDNRSARATLTDGAKTLTLLFSFSGNGLIDTVSTEARGRTLGKKVVPTPWRGRFWKYANRGGMVVPLESEVEWLLAGGPKPYWRGRIIKLDYEMAP